MDLNLFPSRSSEWLDIYIYGGGGVLQGGLQVRGQPGDGGSQGRVFR